MGATCFACAIRGCCIWLIMTAFAGSLYVYNALCSTHANRNPMPSRATRTTTKCKLCWLARFSFDYADSLSNAAVCSLFTIGIFIKMIFVITHFIIRVFVYALTDSLTSEQSIHLIKHKYSISGKESSKCMSTNVVVWRSDTIVFCSIYKQKTTSIYLSHRRFYIQLRHIYTCRNATSALNVYYINAYLIYGTLRFLIKWTALDTLDSNHSLRGVSFLRPPIARGALNNAKW